ncbi:hypothetical protein PYCC9005_003568 [Savitreella phatthalungensis]
MSDWRSRSMQRLSSFSGLGLVPTSKRRSENNAQNEKHDLDSLQNMTLPVELAQSIQSFIVNLTSPVHRAPFSPERLSRMFQDFYTGTSDFIDELLPDPKRQTHGEMLTSSQMAELRQHAEILDDKRATFREEIEERVCIEMYDRIFELRTSDDEVRDKALASKIAEMNDAGFSLDHIGVQLADMDPAAVQKTIDRIGEDLKSLDNALTPRSKLDIVVTCHKSIVDAIQQANDPHVAGSSHANTIGADDLGYHGDKSTTDQQAEQAIMHGEVPKTHDDSPSSSQSQFAVRGLSADAILPILIYAIVRSGPGKLISHLTFIQRFRAAESLSGESAYCLTNLEAAVTFLENFGGDTDEVSAPRCGPEPHEKVPNDDLEADRTKHTRILSRELLSSTHDDNSNADEPANYLGARSSSSVASASPHTGKDESRGIANKSLPGDSRMPPRAEQRERFDQVEQRVRARKALDASSSSRNPSSSNRTNITTSSTNLLDTVIRGVRATPATTSTIAAPATGSSGLTRLANLGMIRSISNSFQATTRSSPEVDSRHFPQAEAHVNSPGVADMSSATTPFPPNSSQESRFLNMHADELTLSDVRQLLAAYKRLVGGQRPS